MDPNTLISTEEHLSTQIYSSLTTSTFTIKKIAILLYSFSSFFLDSHYKIYLVPHKINILSMEEALSSTISAYYSSPPFHHQPVKTFSANTQTTSMLFCISLPPPDMTHYQKYNIPANT